MALLLPRRKAGAVDISEVFDTSLYTGNGSTQTITNGIDLSGEGGLVWIKSRSNANLHFLWDTQRGATKYLISSATDAQGTAATGLTSFNSDGFSIGSLSDVNLNTQSTVAWTFRKSPGFFDVVTYTGDGTAGRTISHNLGVTPGMIVVKRTDTTGAWETYHRSLGGTKYLVLNTTAAEGTAANFWNNTDATSTDFTLGTWSGVNAPGGTYVAYCFAHDTTDNGVIQCGSYTGNGSTTGPTVTLGWEPQWVMIKTSSTTGQWVIMDNQRVFTSPTKGQLFANLSNAEGSDNFDFLSTGFQPLTTNSNINGSGATHIYIAIRKEGV